MAAVDLVFFEVAQAGPSHALVFGDTDTDFVPPASLTLTGVLPTALHVHARDYRTLALSGVLPGMTMVMDLLYASNTSRPTVNRVQAPHQIASYQDAGVASAIDGALTSGAINAATWSAADALGALMHAGHAQGVRNGAVRSTRFAGASRLGTHRTTAPHQEAIRTYSPGRQTGFQAAQRLGNGAVHLPHQDGYHDRRPQVRALWQEALRHRLVGLRDTSGKATVRDFGRSARYQAAMRPPAGQYVPPVITPPWDPCYLPNTALVFADLASGIPNLVFICERHTTPVPGATLVILPARFYMTAHTIYAQRLPDLADVPIFDATVSADSGSYCWTLSASGPQSLFAQLAPVDGLPVQLRVTLDGIPWVFAVDTLSRTSAFGKTGVSVTGRSVTALIGAPYLRATTRTNTEPRLAQQLALDALEYSGVDLDWGLTDWLVSAQAWSHQGTPLDAVQAIVQAAGGYLQSHRSAATLLARHPYSQRSGDNPGAPWGWMTGSADVELAPDAIITEGLERRDGADINAVYVSGTTQGVLAQVKRTGSAADKLATMVTDALITQAAAARQRGLAILGAAGPQYSVRMELPVLTGVGQPGVLDVGQLVQINATVPWRGRVRAVNVNAKSPSLRQSITLERHL